MLDRFTGATIDFKTPLDFIRFGLSEARSQALYFGHGTDNAADDIRVLILDSLNLPHDVDPLLLQARLSEKEKQHLTQQLHKRIQERVPVPYLTHKAFFCGLEFYVDERVLIPRSPLAELIQNQFVPWVEPDSVTQLLDMCTGSGCIAIACAYAFPESTVDAVDISTDALAVATINCQRHELNGAVHLIQSDCFASVAKKRYDIIVSNPPYVGQKEMATLPKEYNHEPFLALQAENEGLAIVDNILLYAADYLTEDGILVVEVGNSDEAVMEAYPELPFTWLEFEHGGHGAFLLTCEQLLSYQASA